MRPRQSRRRGTLTVTAATLVTLCAAQTLTAAASASAAPVAERAAVSAHSHSHSATASAVTAAQDRAARDIARSLGDAAWSARLRTDALKSSEVSVTERASGQLKSQLAAADQDIAEAKGLDTKTGPLLRLRLGDRSMRSALSAGTAPWVAAAVSDDDVTSVTAYDSQGRAHRLDARKAPTRPVYVVDVDSSKALAAGLDVLREELVKEGVQSAAPATVNTAASAAPKAAAATDGYWTTKITAVELSDDEEPWIKGAAEIYTLVSGFGQDGKVRVDPVDMPYLDYEGTVYRPNQILVNWSNYKYNLADAVMMEEDGSTNYRDLAKAIAAVLLTITDQGTYIPLVNAILDAIPNDWWTDDPDYVDSWYTLARNNNGTYYGARGNGWMTVEPYFVQQF
ncbi:DUF3103 domain-containing protein [Streptomyces sp. RY43-2]|uniref:DUF3103 domain-containing protein n=1 Tax=Streptomyces macrolidinus TaxID=2952607 RepID=A0ABT0ZI12_9ACTN|nr:DUF3103 family protein [Streptomyces macrolidinus]MCN9243232.1 DUF3103 domain-containing protein [Streptomyces macrolidinus]